MRNKLEQNFLNPKPEEGETPTKVGVEGSVEKEPAMEIRDHVAERFSALEELAGQVYIENGGTISIAGVAIDQENLSPALVEQVKSLKDRVQSVLGKTARVALKTARVLTISAGLLGGYAAVNLEKPEHFEDKDRARQELVEKGITSEQRYSAYKPGISEMLYEAVKPLGYQDNVDEREFMGGLFKYLEDKGVPNAGMLQDVIPNVAQGREERAKKLEKFYGASGKGLEGLAAQVVPPSEMPSLEDAWRLYLGLPQEKNTFGISNYKPQHSQEDKYYFKVNSFRDDFFRGGVSVSWDEYNISSDSPENIRHAFSSDHISQNNIESAVRAIQTLGGEKASIIVETEYLAVKGGDIMYHFTMSLGEDENGHYISYYDKWDLASSFSQNVITRGVGKPFEIYDRIYYDPVTFKVLEDKP